MLEKLIKQVEENNDYINTYNAKVDELTQDIIHISQDIAKYPYGGQQFVSNAARIAELYAIMKEFIDEIEFLEKENEMLQEDIAELESEVK